MPIDPHTEIRPSGSHQAEDGEQSFSEPRQHTYGQILKSSALIGGSSVLITAIGIGRTKAMALLLGPAGFGLIGLYMSIVDLVVSIAGMGINMSGVRQIADAAGSGKSAQLERTAAVLRRTALLLGTSGALLLFSFSRKVSVLTFGSDQHAGAVALLSFAVLFRLLADGQNALVQGMRRIADLAKIGLLGTISGALASVALVYWLGDQGIALAVVSSAAMAFAIAWWFGLRVRISVPKMTISEVSNEAGALLKLGSAFMASSLMIVGAAYTVRIIVVRQSGLEAAGLYQSAYALGSLYIGLLLQALASDFYPRLVAVADNNSECNRLVNEQARVSLLLAGPGVAATLTLAPLLVTSFYTAEFSQAVNALEWICLGMALRVISWPMGMVMLAKNTRCIFFWSELAWTLVSLVLAWVLVRRYGLDGAGIAFFGTQVFHVLMTYPIIRRLSGFHWSADNRKTGMLFLALIASVFCSLQLLPRLLATAFGILATLASGLFAIRTLLRLVPLSQIPRPIRQFLVWTGLATAAQK